MGKKIILSTEEITQTKIHPVVVFQILDRFLRKSEGQDRVIGTLLGVVEGDVVEITNSFPVPHLEKGDEVAVGKDFHKQMFDLHQCVNSREQIVGWYATSSDGTMISDQSALIHDFYGSECENPVHLVVDTALTGQTVGIHAFTSAPLDIEDYEVINQFQQIQVQTTVSDSEKIALNHMLSNKSQDKDSKDVSSLPSDLDAVEQAMTQLYEKLDVASEYVDAVLAGSVQPDAEIGSSLSDAFASIPSIEPETFDRIFNSSLQDLLMVSYLSTLTKTHLTITEKLSVKKNKQ